MRSSTSRCGSWAASTPSRTRACRSGSSTTRTSTRRATTSPRDGGTNTYPGTSSSGASASVTDAVEPRLELRGLSKSFGGTQALRGVDLAVLPGEVHGLLGENGSGKSTLIKILAGFHDPDGGELLIDGEPVRLPLAPGQFRRLGPSFVHQDLGLIEALSVLETL